MDVQDKENSFRFSYLKPGTKSKLKPTPLKKDKQEKEFPKKSEFPNLTEMYLGYLNEEIDYDKRRDIAARKAPDKGYAAAIWDSGIKDMPESLVGRWADWAWSNQSGRNEKRFRRIIKQKGASRCRQFARDLKIIYNTSHNPNSCYKYIKRQYLSK